MPTLIRLRTLSADGSKIRSAVELTVDYADAASLPDRIRYDRRIWERTGGAQSVNYRLEVQAPAVDIVDENKIIET